MTDLESDLRTIARSMGIVDIGFASADLWDSDPLVTSRIVPGGRPKSIMIGCRSAIILGIPISNATVQTAPSIAYNHAYKNINTMLDIAAQRIAMELMARGFEAMPIPRDGYHGITGLRDTASAFFSHRHAAYLAGMGTFGVNNVIITPRNGPRIRWVTILTDAELESGRPLTEEVCIHCNKCVKACPQNALRPGHYPDCITDKERCIDRSEMLAKKGISPCGLCVAACPIGLTERSARPTQESKEIIQSYVKE